MTRDPLSNPLGPSTSWVWRKRQFRNVAIVAVSIVGVAHAIGLPHLRLEYGYRGSRSAPLVDWGRYGGPYGIVRIDASDRPQGCPLILFLKPSRPLWGLLDQHKENQP